MILIFSFALIPTASCESTVYNIGVLSVYDEKEKTIEQWTPTVKYLSERVPNSTFDVIPLDYDNLMLAVENADVDFFYANPMLYVEMERSYGASRIATFQPTWNNSPYSGIGGVFITGANRSDINTLQDLKGQSFIAVSGNYDGGFLIPMGELQHNGIDYMKDIQRLTFAQTHDDAILSIVNGDEDVAVVETGTLEHMVLGDKLDISAIKVINQKQYEDYPFVVSTSLYPDWAFARTSSTPDDVSKSVSIALLSILPNSTEAKALDSTGWAVPADYSSTDNLMRELRIGSYANYGKITLSEVFVQHWYLLVLIMMLFVIIEVHSRLLIEREKQAKLEASNNLKDLFTDIMRHDLLNPANIIKGFSDFLYTHETDPQKKIKLGKINKQTIHLISMIDSAASLAKLESFEEMEFEVMDIGRILEDVADQFSLEFTSKDIKLQLDLNGKYMSSVNLIIDEVFSNFVSNAIKYSPSGSTVRLEIADAGKNWKVMVTDEGDGVPDEYKKHIFERFKRATKKGIKGSGLGLAIVKRIVDVHHGSVGVEDNPAGKGSVFWVMLEKA